MFRITDARWNKDVPDDVAERDVKEYYLDIHRRGRKFKTKLGVPPFELHEGRLVMRCDLVGGLKALAAEKLIRDIKEKVLVYVAPRSGHAAYAIAKLAQMYGKRAIFFCPASKRISEGQACVIPFGGEVRFVRIAAMPVLNSYAKKFAEKYGYKFLPFGLSGIPEVTAGIVSLAHESALANGLNPDRMKRQFFSATSTGTMIRGLQMGWPRATPVGIAVARNIHEGEVGRAEMHSSDLAFLQRSKVQPPFPTTACYDAKAWEPCLNLGTRGSIFINVGADEYITEAAAAIPMGAIDSAREWGDHRDLERPLCK